VRHLRLRRRILTVAIVTVVVLVPLVGLGGLGYASSAALSTAGADQYSTSTTTTTTTTPTTTSTSTITSSTTTPTTTSTSTITSSTTTPTTTSTSTITSSTTTPTTTSTSTITSSTTTPTSTKPGKGCGDKNHLHDRRFECKIDISDVQSKEGKSGTTAFTFVVSLSGNPLSPVTVSYATAAGTATTPSDFQPASGTLSFPAGASTRTITITVVADTVRERNETFYVNLSNPSANAYTGDAQGVGTIVNDD
jgi:Calx-beta domain